MSASVDLSGSWQAAIDQAKQLNSDMEPEIANVHLLEEQTDKTRDGLSKVQDKLRAKNTLYDQCVRKKQEKQAVLDRYGLLLA